MRIPADADWAGSEQRCSTHAGLQFHRGHLVYSWVASDQVRAPSSGEAELYGIVDALRAQLEESSRRHMYEEELERTIEVDVETDFTAAIGMCSRTGVGKSKDIQLRWLWIQDAICYKVVRLKKVTALGTRPTCEGPVKNPSI